MSGRRPLLIAAVAAALLAPALAQAQQSDLVTASEKEKERRKKAKAKTTTYTDKDLPGPKGTEAPAAGTNANASPSPSPAPAGESRTAPKDESYWRNRTKSLREAIAAAEARAQKAEEDYAASRRPGSQPLPTDVVGPEGGLAQLPPDPAYNPAALKLQKELDDAKAALAAARKALEDFEEEARKAGVPAGWLR